MMKLPSVKRALKPLCWMVASECSRMYIRFLEDVIGGGCSVPQSLLRSGASLLGPSNTCHEKIKWSIFFSNGSIEKTFISFPLLCFMYFDPDIILLWAVQTSCALLILSGNSQKMCVFQVEAAVTLVTEMPQANIFFHVYWVLKQLSFNNPDIPAHLLFSVKGYHEFLCSFHSVKPYILPQ